MGIADANTVIELVDSIKRGDAVPLQGGKLGNFMSQRSAASLQKKAEEWVASTVDQLLLYLSTVDKCLIPKKEYSHLSHRGGVLEDCWGFVMWEFQGILSREKTACITASI